MYGYFDSGDQTTPAYDPGLDIPCPFCKEPFKRIIHEELTTISVMSPGSERCYFYRAHKACYHAATPDERAMYDELPLAVTPPNT